MRKRIGSTKADLRGKDLSGVDLRGKDLIGADLRGVNLRGAILRDACLYWANLRGADLSGADLRGAWLEEAYIAETNLSGVDFSGAYLCRTYLYRTYLSGADLREADLSEARFSGADLTGARLPLHQICPKEGPFTAFKKLRGGIVAELRVPANAKRVSPLGSRKCRTERAKVVALSQGAVEDFSIRAPEFRYGLGEYVEAPLDEDIREVCTSGIHFFMTKKEAEEF